MKRAITLLLLLIVTPAEAQDEVTSFSEVNVIYVRTLFSGVALQALGRHMRGTIDVNDVGPTCADLLKQELSSNFGFEITDDPEDTRIYQASISELFCDDMCYTLEISEVITGPRLGPSGNRYLESSIGCTDGDVWIVVLPTFGGHLS